MALAFRENIHVDPFEHLAAARPQHRDPAAWFVCGEESATQYSTSRRGVVSDLVGEWHITRDVPTVLTPTPGVMMDLSVSSPMSVFFTPPTPAAILRDRLRLFKRVCQIVGSPLYHPNPMYTALLHTLENAWWQDSLSIVRHEACDLVNALEGRSNHVISFETLFKESWLGVQAQPGIQEEELVPDSDQPLTDRMLLAAHSVLFSLAEEEDLEPPDEPDEVFLY